LDYVIDVSVDYVAELVSAVIDKVCMYFLVSPSNRAANVYYSLLVSRFLSVDSFLL